MNKLWISTEASRLGKNWKNQELHWEQLVDKLRRPKVTSETLAEYLAMKPDKQGAIKDVGGFVGGIITGGRRKIGSVSARYLITLDIDYADKYFWDAFCLEFTNEALLYSTHKHSNESPRYRLVMPLAAPVMSDQYEAIGRKIAGLLGIELFDPTTFQPERLMYWPSVSKDAKYVMMQQKSEWLDGDEVLSMYTDWTDASQWPISDKVKHKIRSDVDKQEDPTTKGGLIGAFCRVYGVAEAIDRYLSEVYMVTDHDDRYTYTHGSTSGGMVVYDNLFSFSHHSTDPSNGRLCNAFDLVRIHLYGHLDKDVKDGTPQGRKPSFIQMSEMMVKDPEIKKLVVNEKLGTLSDGGSDDWKEKLDIDKKSGLLQTINNCVLVLSNDERLKGRVKWNDFQKTTHVEGDLPWRKVEASAGAGAGGEWTDADDAELRGWLELNYGLTSRNQIADALTVVMQQNCFHPVKAYLSKLEWDKTERLDLLLVNYLGAEDSRYVRTVTRKTFVAAVARVYEPGVKFDTVLTLVGPQGIGKSRLIKAMFGKWYSDTFGNLQSKDAMENIQGVWGMEIGELAGLKKHEVDLIKLFISATIDRFRVAFGRRVQSYPRQCVFIASTNERMFLVDQTGNRRWWPVMLTGGIGGKEGIKQEEVNQLWAEACYWYAMGEELYLDKEDDREAKKVQENYTEQDERKDGILKYLEVLLPTNWIDLNIYERKEYLNCPEGGVEQREWVTVPEIWLEHLNGKINDMTPYNTKFIRNIMNKLEGWKSHMLNKKPYGYQRGWARTVGVADQIKQS